MLLVGSGGCWARRGGCKWSLGARWVLGMGRLQTQQQREAFSFCLCAPPDKLPTTEVLRFPHLSILGVDLACSTLCPCPLPSARL